MFVIAAGIVLAVFLLLYEYKIAAPRRRQRFEAELKVHLMILSEALDLIPVFATPEPERLRCCRNNCVRAVSTLLSGNLEAAYDAYSSVRADFFGLVERSRLAFPAEGEIPAWLFPGARRLCAMQNKLAELGTHGTYQCGLVLCASKHLANAWAYLFLKEFASLELVENEISSLLEE